MCVFVLCLVVKGYCCCFLLFLFKLLLLFGLFPPKDGGKTEENQGRNFTRDGREKQGNKLGGKRKEKK